MAAAGEPQTVLLIIAGLHLITGCGEQKEKPTAKDVVSERVIIDMHLHAFHATWSDHNTPFNFWTGKPSLAITGDKLLFKTIEQLDRYNIRLAVLSGPLASVYEWMTVAPKRFIGAPKFPMAFLTVDTTLILEPYIPKIDEIREGYKSGKIGAIGEITSWYAGIAPDDPTLEPFFALAEELDIPVGIHAAIGPKELLRPEDRPNVRAYLSNPELIEEVLVKHPHLRLYLSHAGYPYLHETIALMGVYTNVYADISSLNWRNSRQMFYAYLKTLIAAGLEKRLMFGSDANEFPEAIGLSIETIEKADFLTEQQKDDIFYNNAARFLKLSNEVIKMHHSQ